ncbi:hypothetical protein K466DRAFT_657746 [Polyporus arcularius HHB13444]|uniref:Mating-type protein A-alpha/beta 1 N-terminal domain-containing protein n=1 Tax=Polyporus arcularius HHB13444 TaxID=1314778 RepID=A0A5C3Q2F6_9APHY|nr:hypothetical protein K466DRAFT_657746 [Polyporus arcularius HHB13444]
MLSSLSSRLLAAENDFVSSLIDGEEAMLAFNQRWERLVEDVDVALESTGLDEELASLMHATAERIATLADISADIYVNYNTFTLHLIDQIDSLMLELAIVDDDQVPRLAPPAEKVSARSRSHEISRKRRRASSPDSNLGTCKRARTTASPTYTRKYPRCPPRSPTPPSDPTSDQQTPKSMPPPHCARQDAVTSHSRSCKRRLSASDVSGPPVAVKRLRTGPRVHAVSDSFVPMRSPDVLESVFSSWSSSSPSPCLPPDTSTPLDIQALGIQSDPVMIDAGTTAFGGDFTKFWADTPVDSFPASNDGLDTFLQFLVIPVADSLSAPATNLGTLISLAPPCPLSPSALATLPLESVFDYPDSPSSLASGSSRPVTPLDFANDLEPYIVASDGRVSQVDDGARLPSYAAPFSPFHDEDDAFDPSSLESPFEVHRPDCSFLPSLYAKWATGSGVNDAFPTEEVSSVVGFFDLDPSLPSLSAHDLDPIHCPRLQLCA